MRPGDGTWLGQSRSSTYQGCHGSGMVRRFEWRNIGDAIAGQRAAERTDRGDLQLLRLIQRAHDAGHARGKHGLAGAGRAGHEQMVASGRRDFQSPFGRFLADHFAHVSGRRALGDVHTGSDIALGVRYMVCGMASHQFDEFAHMAYADHVDVVDEPGLVDVGVGYDDLPYALFPRMQHDR